MMSQDLIPLTQLGLPIPDALNDRAWHQSRAMRSVEAQWNIYLNQIAGQMLLSELQADFAAVTWWDNPPSNPVTVPSLWQFIRGTVLQLNQKRLVLLPTQTIDQGELVIPQEWVDIPAWAGDYFLAVQVDADAQWLHCWGYVTHQRLKAKAQYDPDDRTYRLDACDIIPDVTALWVVQRLNPTEVTQAAIAPLPAINTAAAANWQQRLVNARVPRLEIPFEQWGALVVDPAWRQGLADLQQGEMVVAAMSTTTTPITTQLGEWMQNVFTTGWQTVEEWLGNDLELALALRQTTLSAVPTVRRVKALRLPTQLLLLLLTITPDDDGVMAIQVQLRVSDRHQTIPADLNLELVAHSGTIVQAVQARDQDNAIQLRRFRSPVGTQFSIQVRLNGPSSEFTFSELFVV
jgi:Protein of unknown function (DUF1822)